MRTVDNNIKNVFMWSKESGVRVMDIKSSFNPFSSSLCSHHMKKYSWLKLCIALKLFKRQLKWSKRDDRELQRIEKQESLWLMKITMQSMWKIILAANVSSVMNDFNDIASFVFA